MLCELCGRETPFTKLCKVEGSALKVCSECARFGDPVETRPMPGRANGAPSGGGTQDSQPFDITQRLERRARRQRSRDVFENVGTELVVDYSNRIRNARMKRNWSQDDLGKKISERKSVIAQLESGSMYPDDKLIKKLEHVLAITLTESVDDDQPASKGQKRGMTLGDYIRREKA